MPIFTINMGFITLSPTWYGLMYVLAFIIGFIFMKKMIRWHSQEDLESLLFFVFLGVLIGGRIGYVILYNPLYYWSHPLEIFAIWNGGMSFHGGFIGVIIAVSLFAKIKKYRFWNIIDHLAIITPIGLGLGRIGNWINQELPGFSPYAGPFPMIIHGVPHFPSPLLEMFLEGIVFSFIMYISVKRACLKKEGLTSSIFIVTYAIMRLIAEQWRLPDTHIGYLFGTNFITLGMVYTSILLLVGVLLYGFKVQKKTLIKDRNS